jgi:hypothetical protein
MNEPALLEFEQAGLGSSGSLGIPPPGGQLRFGFPLAGKVLPRGFARSTDYRNLVRPSTVTIVTV